MKVRALYPLYPPLRIDSDESKALYDELVSYFATTRTARVKGSFVHDGETITIQSRPCTTRERERFFRKAPFLKAGDAVLEFAGTFEFPGEDKFFHTDSAGVKTSETREELESSWRGNVPLDLEATIQTYLCSLMIAFPGAVRPIGNVWLLDGAEYSKDRFYRSEIHESIEFLREKNAFPHINVDVDKITRWAFVKQPLK